MRKLTTALLAAWLLAVGAMSACDSGVTFAQRPVARQYVIAVSGMT